MQLGDQNLDKAIEEKEHKKAAIPKQSKKQYQIRRRADKCAFQHGRGINMSAWGAGGEGINGTNWTERRQETLKGENNGKYL